MTIVARHSYRYHIIDLIVEEIVLGEKLSNLDEKLIFKCIRIHIKQIIIIILRTTQQYAYK